VIPSRVTLPRVSNNSLHQRAVNSYGRLACGNPLSQEYGISRLGLTPQTYTFHQASAEVCLKLQVCQSARDTSAASTLCGVRGLYEAEKPMSCEKAITARVGGPVFMTVWRAACLSPKRGMPLN
jgi:hypothetical protein